MSDLKVGVWLFFSAYRLIMPYICKKKKKNNEEILKAFVERTRGRNPAI